MDPITLIVTALAAGAASAMQDDAKAAVKTAFERLRHLVKKRFASPQNGEFMLEKHAAAPDIWRAPLQQELEQSGAGSDPELVDAAQALMKLLDPGGTGAGKYVVTVSNSSGVQIGDHNSQVNHFGSMTAGRDNYQANRDITVYRTDT
ncbi:MAG TPA: RIP homotypic interaction motif-containing protein [Trebonia sp.]|nr:RIP homotypic interaction motif-containing protein [Trebonia sp.]